MTAIYSRIKARCITDANGCWVWPGAKTGTGYGQVRLDGKKPYTHILMYVAVNGPVPDGLELDHLCRNRACCNPDHLEAVTHAENLRRSPIHNGNKTHCKHGHVLPDKVPGTRQRRCYACERERTRERKAKGTLRLCGTD